MKTPLVMRSVQATAESWAERMISWSGEASAGRFSSAKPPPMCIDSTMPSRSAASRTPSQWSPVKAGRPLAYGVSGKLTVVQPLAAIRSSSVMQSSVLQSGRIPIGMIRPGYDPASSSICQSL